MLLLGIELKSVWFYKLVHWVRRDRRRLALKKVGNDHCI